MRVYRATNRESIREQQRKWNAANPDKLREMDRRKYAKHGEKICARVARHKAANRETVLAGKKAHYLKNRDRYIARFKQRYINNREAFLEKMRQSYQENKERHSIYHKRRYAANPAHFKAKARKWYDENPERARANSLRSRTKWRSRLFNAPGWFTQEQVEARIAYHGWRCRYCRCELNWGTVRLDHQISLKRGGSNWPANLVPACQSCNSSKQDKPLDVWLRERHYPKGRQCQPCDDHAGQYSCQ